MKTSIFLFLLCLSFVGASQSCEKLKITVKSDGDLIGTIKDNQMNSSFVKKASAYEYKGTLYVIAAFQRGGTYIYCEVPKKNWLKFIEDCSCSYGKKFHSYVTDYTCDCK